MLRSLGAEEMRTAVLKGVGEREKDYSSLKVSGNIQGVGLIIIDTNLPIMKS